jgi:3-deoxy-D-arabino-heptulosonate 7-phosphate (DAHP) synthase
MFCIYCALFDESHKIERGVLIESFIKEGIIKEMSRQASLNNGHSILDRLELIGLSRCMTCLGT